PAELLRRDPPLLPEVAEVDLVRHYTRLSQMNHAVDTGFYPLGSCTMKYNPKVAERVAALPGFADLHPYVPDELAQGAVQGGPAVMGRATILIVDDEPDLTRLLAEHLAREGFATRMAPDAETALRLLDEEPCDLVILDIMLPGMDGIDLLRRIRDPRRGWPDLPVIMLSARGSAVDKTVGLSLGADDYVA